MNSFRHDKKGEDDDAINILQNLDKTMVLQESRYFNTSSINPRKCIYILTKVLCLINQGEILTVQEATEIFFATTKLFQSKDVSLRRLVYLSLKELGSVAQDVIIVTSSLIKDMTGKEDLLRAAAIRALCTITDSTMLQAIERHMKQAIVDKNPAVSSAALVSALHLSVTNPDQVRRWVNEAQEQIMSDDPMVSYHALAVVAKSRKNDRLSLIKLVTNLTRSPIRSSYTLCLLIRYVAKLAEEDLSETSEQYLGFIESCLRHKSEIVVYEAVCAVINLKKNSRALVQVVSVLQIFCGSSKATLRLAGARSLAKLTAIHSSAVAACTFDLENLISDPNKSVATLAVTTLLETASKSYSERLMKSVVTFMNDISDEFKIIVVQSIRHLCFKYPRKHLVLLTYLAGMLRDEGGLQYKTATAEAIITLIEENSDAKELGLVHLCEFIEDCEHTTLAIRILYVLGHEGPKTSQPFRYIRYIYNRVILESGPVRAAAVAAVARFGASCPDLLPNIRVLLSRCQLDEDDEVRDRAVCYNALLDSNDRQLINKYILRVQVPNIIILERALQDHTDAFPDKPFDIVAVPTEVKLLEIKDPVVKIQALRKQMTSLEEQYAEAMKVFPDLKTFDPLFKTCEPVDLTEPETEYRVCCIKHVLARYLVLQFECLNTLDNQLLKKVHVSLDLPSGYKCVRETSCEELSYDKKGSVFCILTFPEKSIETLGTFGATLEFMVHDCDPTTGLPYSEEGYSDAYPIEDVEIGCSEQFRMRPATDEFENLWESASTAFEACDTFGLAQTDVGEAARAVCEHLGLPKTAISGDAVKEIKGCGLWRGGAPVFIKARLVANQGVVTMQLAIRSPREGIATLLLAAVG